MSVVVVGLNHRTVPLDVLERMTVSDARLPKALHDLLTREHLTEALVLSTCMRTEIYAVAANGGLSLVTGNSGLLGSCLTSLLLGRGEPLRLFDLVPPNSGGELPRKRGRGGSP